MTITGSHISMYHACKRELWLNFHNINMEHTSDLVYEGKLISETAYSQRSEKYTELELKAQYKHIPLAAKIDFYDAKNKVVHEVKKSDKLEQAHIAQVQFYLYVLEKNGLQGVSAILEYPKLRQTLPIPALSEEVRSEIETWIQEIEQVLHQKPAPVAVKKTYCKTCSFYDFCFVNE
ncbi:MAG: CRISPR-associated protein Cas4 [Bacteroidia bacterium]|nr:CRISPR-associated protein Cas4 [Bacteroidia bacterium]